MRFPDLDGWLGWQAGLHSRSIDLGLERVGAVWRRLGEPPPAPVVISVAGTNGKGSGVAFAEAVLRAAGYRTGSYTSPHLQRYNERIRLHNLPVADASICAAFERIDDARGEIPLTYFEFGTLAALWIFANASLDAVILEVGLGGRLDAVNLIDADVALITSIGLDHQDWLGDDRESIGREKAGIIRPGRAAVFSGHAMPASIAAAADAGGTRLWVAGSDYRIERREHDWDLLGPYLSRTALPLPTMRGSLQIENAAGALVALDCLSDRLSVDQAAVRCGLLNARVAGRFELRPGVPTWILDVAHNPDAALALDAMLGELHCAGRRIAICGILADKDAAGIAAALAGRFDEWILVDLAAVARGRSAEALSAAVQPEVGGVRLRLAPGVEAAMAAARDAASAQDQVVVFGSFSVVGPALTWLEEG